MGMKDWFKHQLGKLNKSKVGESKTVASIATIPNLYKDAFQKPTISRFSESRTGALTPEQRLAFGAQQKIPLRGYIGRHQGMLGQNLITLWTQQIDNRRKYIQISYELEQYYITGTLLECISQDVLNPNEKNEIIEFTSDDPAIKQALDEFAKEHDINNLIREIIADLINFGEYTLRLEVDPERQVGVTGICNDLNQLGVVALYEKGMPCNYLIIENHDYTMVPALGYAHFVINDRKMRVKIDDAIDPDYQIDFTRLDPELAKKLPDYICTGKPFFYGVVQKIRELQLLEQLVVALKMNQITESKLVQLRVPATMPVKEVTEAITDLEEILNSQTSIDLESGQLTISEILTVAGRFKVIPNFSDEKGSVEPIEARQDQSVEDLVVAMEHYRKIILSSVGIPYSLIYGSEDAETEKSKASELRRFGRYARKLTSIQWGVAKGLKQIGLAHLVNLDENALKATMDSFQVTFKNSMVDLSSLEKMEYDDAKQEMVVRKIDFINKILENPILAKRINEDGVFQWLEDSFNDLTNGIPLFTVYDNENVLDPAEDKLVTHMKDRLITVAADKFIQKRNEREKEGEGVPIEDADILDSVDDLDHKVEIIQRAQNLFQARRAEKQKNEKAYAVATKAVDNFMKRRKERQQKAAANK